MVNRVDPLRQLRPIREDELGQLTSRHDPQLMAGPLAYDVYRTGDTLVIEFDVPGIDRSELDVSVEDRALVVNVCRKLAQGNGVDVIETGRQHGVFSQRLFLGERWDLENLSAETRHGVLYVRAPVMSHPVRRHLDVSERSEGEDASSVRGPADRAAEGPGWSETGRDDHKDAMVAHSAA